MSIKPSKTANTEYLDINLSVDYAEYDPQTNQVKITLRAQEVDLIRLSMSMSETLREQGIAENDCFRIVDSAIRTMERELTITALANSIIRSN